MSPADLSYDREEERKKSSKIIYGMEKDKKCCNYMFFIVPS